MTLEAIPLRPASRFYATEVAILPQPAHSVRLGFPERRERSDRFAIAYLAARD